MVKYGAVEVQDPSGKFVRRLRALDFVGVRKRGTVSSEPGEQQADGDSLPLLSPVQQEETLTGRCTLGYRLVAVTVPCLVMSISPSEVEKVLGKPLRAALDELELR